MIDEACVGGRALGKEETYMAKARAAKASKRSVTVAELKRSPPFAKSGKGTPPRRGLRSGRSVTRAVRVFVSGTGVYPRRFQQVCVRC